MAWALASSGDLSFSARGAMVMFCSTVLWGKRLKCWNTMPIFCRWRLMSTDLSARSTPSKMICPAVGSSSRFSDRSSVDLPEPEGPIMATTSPWLMSRLQSFSAFTVPRLYSFTRC